MSDYQRNRTWSDVYIPAIKEILGPLVLEESSFEVDTQQATDLIVLTAVGKSFACRVRRPGFADRYPYDVTFRAGYTSGAKTELAKIKEGFGDYAFYGHANDNKGFVKYWVIDLDVFRSDMKNRRKELVWAKQKNRDGKNFFVAFDVRSFSAGAIVKTGGNNG